MASYEPPRTQARAAYRRLNPSWAHRPNCFYVGRMRDAEATV